MPQPGETLVHLPHMSHATSAGLRRLYERVESGALPNIPTKVALSRTAQEKMARYPHGKKVGPYLLGRTIGEGSFAKVKEALHSVVGEKVAIKVIDKNVVREDPYLRKNMRREAGLLQSLRQHPNIISLYEVMETDNNFYMVLELCNGGALLDRICSEKCLLEEEARRYVRQIVSAVDHMHQAGILHRDLKVENLLLDGNNNIKIIDFGLSNIVGTSNGRMRAEYRATQCGSPAYAAPEIIANKRYGPKVDVWSIGVNTFAMLAGCLPFTVEPFNIKLLLKKIDSREMAEIPSHLSSDCKDFIRKLLHPDPRIRYSIIETMNHRWLAADKGALTRPRTPSPPPSGRMSRMELETDILEYIWSNMGYDINHVTNSVISKRADEYSAIYYLLLCKRDRQHLKMLRKLEGTVYGGEKDAKDAGISGPNLYDEATAMELAGRKNGSLHFKMALLLEQETEVGTSEEENTEIEPTNRNGQDISDEPTQNENHVTSSSDKNQEGAITPWEDNRRRARQKEPRNTTQHIHNDTSFHSNVHALRIIKSKALATEEIRNDWKETSKKVAATISDNPPGTRAVNTGYKLSTAHEVNLTFKQSDAPSENFANHFNYRRGETGKRMKLILAPTRTANLLPSRKVNPNSTWRQSDSIDSVNLQNRLDGLQISPRNENLEKEKKGNVNKEKPDKCDIQPSTQAQQDTSVKFKNTRNMQHPVSPTFEIISKRRQLKVSKRKSIDNINLRRSIRIQKGASSDAKMVARLPGRPKTPVGSETQTGSKRKVSGTAANQKRRELHDKSRSQRRKKSTTKKVAEPSDEDRSPDKCAQDHGLKGDSQVVPPTHVMPEAAPPLTKKLSKKIKPPKASLTNKRLVCNEVSAETDG